MSELPVLIAPSAEPGPSLLPATATATATVVDSHAPLEVFSTVLTATRQHTGIHNYNVLSYRR